MLTLINIVNVSMNPHPENMPNTQNTSGTASTTSGAEDPPVAPPGLKGLVVADTTIGRVRGDEGFFHYRQYDATELARRRSFEAVAALLIDGELPDAAGEAAFRAELAAARHLDPGVSSLLAPIAQQTSDLLAALRSMIPMVVPTVPTIDMTHEERRAATIRVAGAVPTIVAGIHRLQRGEEPLTADPGLSHATDYIRMVTGSTPTPTIAQAVERYLLLTLDHGFNASTFTTRVITSTGADVSSAISGAVGALSGPLHGGAPRRVLDMIDDIGDPATAESWAQAKLAAGDKIMGFGHAVYRAADPRTELLRETAIELGGELVERAIAIEHRILQVLSDFKPEAVIVTNVEYYAAIVMHLSGLDQDMFTPTFTTSRVVGWSAHLLEQATAAKIIRPSARYVGLEPAQPVPQSA